MIALGAWYDCMRSNTAIRNIYSLRFILFIVLESVHRLKKINFTYFQEKNIITNTSNHILTNRKNRLEYKVNKFYIKIIKRHLF